MTAARSRVATGTAGGAGGPREAVAFGVLPAGHQPRGERGRRRQDDAAGAAQVSLRVTTASEAAHSPGAHATTARRAGAGRCARGRGGDVVPDHADIMSTPTPRAPISGPDRPSYGREIGRMARIRREEPGDTGRQSPPWHPSRSRSGRSAPHPRRRDGEPGPGRRQQRTPRTPTRAHLPLLPSGPGGVRRDDAARGVCAHPSPGRRPTRNPVGRGAIRPGRRGPVSSLRCCRCAPCASAVAPGGFA